MVVLKPLEKIIRVIRWNKPHSWKGIKRKTNIGFSLFHLEKLIYPPISENHYKGIMVGTKRMRCSERNENINDE
jgi:hypothetical protein